MNLNIIHRFCILSFLILIVSACTHSIEEVNALVVKSDTTKDIGQKVKIIYSDSGFIKLTIEAPVLERYNDFTEPKDVFPEGIFITFMDENKQPMSWLKADYAVRSPKTKTMVAKGNVQFYNTSNDKLQSAELIWDEQGKKIYTDKFIKITQPQKGDTIYGMGFETDHELKRMEIKTRVKAKIKSTKVDI